MPEIRTLVVTSCTGEKKYKPENQLLQEDFREPARLAEREQELSKYRLPAGEMYTGRQHLRLMEGIRTLRAAYGHDIVDLCIVSAGYGLLDENRQIVPYEVTFNNMLAQKIKEWSRYLRIKESLAQKIKDYDLVFFLLGDDYLRALEMPLEADISKCLLFLASKTSRKLIPDREPYHFIEVGKAEAQSFGYGLVGLKGYLFKLLAQKVVEEGRGTLELLATSPHLLLNLLGQYRKEPSSTEQLRLFPCPEVPRPVGRRECLGLRSVDFTVPDAELAKNYGVPVKYFIPEWDDRVDPDYNFINDEPKGGRDPYLDLYAHEIYDQPNYDGVLISKIKVEKSKTKKEKLSLLGVHKFIRFPEERPIMGDCGAFGYINEFEPPYNTREIIDYYQQLGFNYGVSIDHLIIGRFAADPGERQRRFNITRDNAAKFIEEWKSGKYSFEPIGVAQGWDPTSYREAVADLVAMGYKFIALGGLARTPTKAIFEIMRAIRPEIPDYLRVHIFGVARPGSLAAFRRLGMTSFDSASYLRRAWLGSGSNYFLGNERYTAIRVPPVDGNGVRVKKMVREGKGTFEQFRKLEQAALDALRKYDRGQAELEDTLETVLAYDELIGEGRERHAEMYRLVLEDQPWKKCDCKICRELGIEVIIFRGNNRNRRRGFHNTYVFYKQFKEIFS